MSTRASLPPREQPRPSTSTVTVTALTPIIEQLKKMIARELDVRLDESRIDATVSLHEDGLALDSMVLFEFMNLIEKRYGFEFADQDIRPEVFANLTVLAAHIHGQLMRADTSLPPLKSAEKDSTMSTGERPAPDELTRRGFVTHYPPARYWRPEGLQGLLNPRPLNVYVHLPYCIQRCAYCHYKTTTLAEHRKSEIDAYVSALCREIALVSRRFHLEERPTTSVYFGGGTPTLLSRENLSRLMDSLREHLSLEEPEITLEAEPVTLTPSKAEHLQALGVNRISLGIQSFCDDILRRTGRHDTEQHAFTAIALAKATGAIVNVDLMSGLAGETERTWAYTIERALAADVHSLTVYKTELHANTDYYADIKRKTLTLPTDDEELRFITHALEQFERHDYQPVNFFTFTRGGAFRQRHISSRWLGTDTYGFGVSAFGSLDAHVMQNTSDLPRYLQTLEAGELPLTRGYRLSARELMTREVVLGMKLIHLDLAAFQQRHGFDLARWCAPVVEELEKHGFVTLREHTLSLTRKGILWGDYVGRRLAARIESLA